MSGDKRMTLRVPESLNKWIVRTAKEEGRTKNAHIVEILKVAKAEEIEKKLEAKLI